ncbi:hypothetical protein ACFLYL_00865 [Chloroflexota bacterium]
MSSHFRDTALGGRFTYVGRAITYSELGEKQKALADYIEFLKLCDGSEFFNEVKQDIDKLHLELYPN